MIKLNIHTDLDASALAVETSAAKNLISDLESDPMAGWLNLPTTLTEAALTDNPTTPSTEKSTKDPTDLSHIKSAAAKIRSNSDYLVCIGIGGSYLGHRAVIEALDHQLKDNPTKVLYTGNSISTIALQKILDEIGDKDFSVNVISKSGTTTEPAIAFRIFKQKLIEKYGEQEAASRIYATTDAEKGALHDEAIAKNYEIFVIPDNVGGRYSIFTPVGLLPLAAAGVDIEELLKGAAAERAAISDNNSQDLFTYAAARHLLRSEKEKDYTTEVLACFEPCMSYVSEWWKQLFGESEGKENSGIFPASVSYTTDLHSLGQYMQQGRPNLFETFLTFEESPIPGDATITEVPTLTENLDGLKYLEGRLLTEINKKAEQATITAHSEHLPVLEITLPDLSAHSLGALIYFFELSCALSAKLQGVNPFDQPGVERYKNEMFRLLGKN